MAETVSALSEQLAILLGQHPLIPADDFRAYMEREDADFFVASKTRSAAYPMVWTPEGIAVHQGEGCEHEQYGGPMGCWHSKEYTTMTQALTRYEAGVPQRTEFSDEQVSVIKNTIAKGATDAELGLFIATCRRTGLDPFMRQIWAIQRKSNEGTRENPKWVTTMQIQVGIDGYRVIRDRTGEFDGMEGPQWSEDGQTWLDYPYDPKPKFARVAVYRKGISRPFVAVARWEAYNQNNAMWSTMGAEQLAKCAEALSYRRAFPAEMSALPSGPVAELDAPSEEELADMPQVAALLEPAEGEYREVEPEPETAAADIPAPSDLLKAIAAKHGPQVVVQAKGIMPYLYGTGDFLKLNDEQRKDFAARLRVWLEDKDHAHVEQYTQEEPPRLVCERCGVDLEKLTPVQAPMV